MKSLAVAILLIGYSALAGEVRAFRCSNGEEIDLKIRQIARNEFNADIVLQSVGGSYPKYHFKNLVKESDLNVVGAATFYRGEGFELTVHHHQYAELYERGVLSIPSLGLNGERLNCERP